MSVIFVDFSRDLKIPGKNLSNNFHRTEITDNVVQSEISVPSGGVYRYQILYMNGFK